MSLINQMLKDLDERRAVAGDAMHGHRDVRPLPQRRRSVWPRFAVGSGLVGVAAAAIWVFFPLGPARPLPVLPQAATSAAVDAGLPALAATSEGPSMAPLPVDEPEPSRDDESDRSDRLLRLSSQLSSLPAAKPEPGAPRGAAPVAATAPRSPAPPVESTAPPAQAKADARAAAGGPGTASAMRAAPPSPALGSNDAGRIDKQAIEATPQERAERLYRSARGLLAQGRIDAGLTTVRAALREDARHVAARQWLVKHYLDSRAFDAAQGVLQDGLAVMPQQTAWSLLLSRLQADRGDNAAALQTLELALPHAAGTPDVEGALGAILQRLGRHGDAEQRFAAAAQLEPARARWWLGLALAGEAQGKAAEARAAFRRAAELRDLPPDLQAFVEQKIN